VPRDQSDAVDSCSPTVAPPDGPGGTAFVAWLATGRMAVIRARGRSSEGVSATGIVDGVLEAEFVVCTSSDPDALVDRSASSAGGAGFDSPWIAVCMTLGSAVPTTAANGRATMHTIMIVARNATIPDDCMAGSTPFVFRLSRPVLGPDLSGDSREHWVPAGGASLCNGPES
jgi:hypothetical protein